MPETENRDRGGAAEAGSAAFPTLLSPLRVGAVTLRNRVVMGSMHTRLDHAPDPLARQIAFYAERARGGVAMIVTGGFAPNEAGLMEEDGPILATEAQARALRPIVEAVHAEGAKFLLQILHAGRYARHAAPVGASAIPSPINPQRPRALTGTEIEQTVADYVRCAELAASAGFDGVEVMGSEGYLITQFTTRRTNDRDDEWGGALENRLRFPIEIVRRTRAALGPDFLVMYRISALDLVEGGATADEIDAQARAVEAAGADILNTGIGWHEARVPTIAYPVPRAAWRFAAARLKRVVSIPVVASNRISTPDLAEEILAGGEADLVSMARPLLADAEFVRKASEGRADEIAPCIACNQACLDYIFSGRVATCLVNPRAGREVEFDERPPIRAKRVAVIGAGPAGLACATTAARRGHEVVLFEAAPRIGGQMALARHVPGKQEFDALVGHYRTLIARYGVELRLGRAASADAIAAGGFEHVVIAAGVVPRIPEIPGVEHPMVLRYDEVLAGAAQVGRRVAILGAGGIGFDMAEYLAHEHQAIAPGAFLAEWGVDPTIASPGGLAREAAPRVAREITVLQRKPSRPGSRLGVSTGWILRASLRRRNVAFIAGCIYRRIDDAGLHYEAAGEERLLAVDNIVLCTGQEPARAILDELRALPVPVDIIGGAEDPTELDALRAIDEGVRLAYRL